MAISLRLWSALQALEARRPAEAWELVRPYLDRGSSDFFVLGVAAEAQACRDAELVRRAAAASPPTFPGTAELEFMRRLDETGRRRREAAARIVRQAARFLREGDVQRAQVFVNRARALDDGAAEVLFYRGMLAAAEKRKAAAKLCFVEALRADRAFDRARRALENLLSGRPLASIAGLL